MSDSVTFSIETSDGDVFGFDYNQEAARSIHADLKQASHAFVCDDCDILAPVKGDLPRGKIPDCPECNEQMDVVVGVGVADEGES